MRDFPECASLRIRREEDGSVTLIARDYMPAATVDRPYAYESVDIMIWSLT